MPQALSRRLHLVDGLLSNHNVRWNVSLPIAFFEKRAWQTVLRRYSTLRELPLTLDAELQPFPQRLTMMTRSLADEPASRGQRRG